MPLTLHLGNALVHALGECPWEWNALGMPLVCLGNALDNELGNALGNALGMVLGMALAMSLMSARACTLEGCLRV